MTADFSVIEQLDFSAGTVSVNSESSLIPSALKRHYVQQAKRFGDEGIDKIYFSGEYPSVYFKSVSAFTPDVIQLVVRIQRKIWNQGKVPLLYVESPTEVRVYNCYETPQKETKDNAEEDLRLIRALKSATTDLKELNDVFNKVAIESGSFWEEGKYASRFDVEKRVDQALIENIKKTRKQLQLQGLSLDTIHDLLLRSLFVLYLEDRGATDPAFYEKYLPGADSYFTILADVSATYRLFATLETAFNGNLCPVQPSEFNDVKPHHLEEIKRCFWSNWALSHQSALFNWRIFDFEFIPIQIISEIYQDFLSKEVGEDQMAKNGAFYTRHALVEFILNQMLPYPSPSNTEYNVRTLDPTCGSGIFLVDSLNRLLDRWEYVHQEEKLTFETIKQIVLDNIFGIEIEPEAIKVAAFSIYLVMLDRLDPKTLWQNKQFPYLIYDPDKPEQQQGRNLFRMSSLVSGPFDNINFDLVVGNAPFGTKNLGPEVSNYLESLKKLNREHDFPKEIVIAFLHRVTNLCPTGAIALISTSKILFNNGTGYQRFRRFLFNETYVEKVYNFSALRRVSQQLGGRNLFATVTGPVCVLMYSKQLPTEASKHLIYYAPTTTFQNRLIDGIAIDPTDEKFLPRAECQKPDTKIWKVSMWGTERDFQFLQKLKGHQTISETIIAKGWNENKGVGFQTSKPEDKYDPSLKLFPYIEAKKLTRYYSAISQSTALNIEHFSRLGNKRAYQAPHLLIKAGQEKKRFCSSFLDFDCSFRKTIYGVYSQNANELKLLSAYLNSSLAFYLMFLTTATWGVEREEVNPIEILKLPDLCFNLPSDIQQQIVAYVDEIIALKKQNDALSIEKQVSALEKRIEQVLWDGINLTQTDRLLIEDLLNYRLDAFQGRQESDAFKAVRVVHSQAYSMHLCQTINHFLQPDESIQAHAEYFNLPNRTPLQVVILHLDEQKRASIAEKLPAEDINEILRELEVHTYREEAESIYFRRFIRYYKDDTIYIVKPNEQRFWSRSMALNDADEIILEILSSEA